MSSFIFVVERGNDDWERIELTEEQLRTDVEVKLRTAGLPVEEDARPNLYLNVNVIYDQGSGSTSYDVDLRFDQVMTILETERARGKSPRKAQSSERRDDPPWPPTC